MSDLAQVAEAMPHVLTVVDAEAARQDGFIRFTERACLLRSEADHDEGTNESAAERGA